MWMATDRQPLENIVIRGWFWHLHHSCILFRCMKHSIIIVWYIPWKTFSSIIDFDICNTSHKNQGIVIPWKTFSSEVDWKKYDLYIGNKVAFFSDAWWTLSLYIGWPHEPHPTYIDPTDCVPRQRKEQGDLPCAPESKPIPRRSTRWSPCSARSRPASCPASSGGLGRELLRHLGDQDDNQ